jgi:hypothetical protein
MRTIAGSIFFLAGIVLYACTYAPNVDNGPVRIVSSLICIGGFMLSMYGLSREVHEKP